MYYQNTAGQLLEDPAGFLRANWSSQPRRLEATQALFGRMIQALRYHGWSRILVDQLQMTPFTPAEQTWIAQQWLPRAVHEGGYRYGAVLVSPNVIVRLATAYITTQVQNVPLVYRSFQVETEAVKWLLQQPATPHF